MKKTATLVTSIGFWLASLHAQTLSVPKFINYQGTVSDAGGALIGASSPVNRKMIFRLWDHPTLTAPANRLWTEEQTVTISQGQFSVLLGAGIAPTGTAAGETMPLLESVFTNATNSDRYLEVTVDEGGGTITAGDTPITPRQQMTSTAYSFRARSADSVAAGATTGALTVGGVITSSAAINTSSSISAGNIAGTAITGTTFTGNGSGLTNLNASNITTGTMSGALITNGSLGNAKISDLDAGKITTGTMLGARIADGSLGNAKISDLAASKLTGSIADGLLSTNVARRDGNNTFNGDQTLTGNLHMDNDKILWGKNQAQAYEPVFWPRAFNSTYLNYGTGGFYIRNNASAVTMWMNNDGKVGINNTLEVSGGIRARGGAPGANGTSNNGFSFNGGSGDNDGGMFSTADNQIEFYTGNTERMRINSSGFVGIGTTNPIAPLDVRISASVNRQYTGFVNGNGAYDADSSGTTTNFSIMASHAIEAMIYYVASDARIKNTLGQSNSATDLNTLMKIQITDYSFKDVVEKGNSKQKKVIAQQVEEVYPDAVSRSTNVVPDIYAAATSKGGWLTLNTDLKAGERVRLITDSTAELYEVLEVEKDRFRTALKTTEGAQVFVYGREVKDFRTVDYDAIAMLNVSATQELSRRLAAMSAESAKKDVALDLLEKRLAQLEARDQSRDAKLVKLEKLLEETQAASLVSLQDESAK
jgi:hypothetical protein